jgi:hypothetical protein
MELRTTQRTLTNDRSRDPETIAAFRIGVQNYAGYGTPLYSALCAGGMGEPDIIALASHGVVSGRPVHLFSSVHYLLLRDPNDPLARYFATLTEKPLPPDEAFADFARFCRQHREELLHLLQTRTVQTTYVERCRSLMPPMACAADMAGEPLNLIEIGCSAGVLLTFDKYAYEVAGHGLVGRADAPLTLATRVNGNAPLRIPTIGKRVGIDLRTINVQSEEERRWMLALCFPEFREQQARLARALDIVAATDIELLQGDALDMLPAALEKTPDPVCVFHSACLFYWDKPSKAALDSLLREASRNRDIHRVSIEPAENVAAGEATSADEPDRIKINLGEVVVARYRRGNLERRVVGRTTADYGVLDWIDS